MARELSGKVAVVTGGASGIGRATAELFVEEDARVVIADVDAEQGQDLATRLGGAAVFQRTDVSQADQVQEAVDRALSHFGGLDVMFNNAGTGMAIRPFLEDDLTDFERVMGVNLFGVMVGSQRAARHMAKNGGGSIINTTSIAALRPGGGVMAYRASKAGVIQFSRCLAIELGPLGIRVNCIAPGLIKTEFARALWEDERTLRASTQEAALGRIGLPDEMAGAVVYLASPASSFVTGQTLVLDGGRLL